MKKEKPGLNRQSFLLLGSSAIVSTFAVNKIATAQFPATKTKSGNRLETIVRHLFATGESKDPDTFITFFTYDATYRVSNNPALIGQSAIRESVAQYFPSVQSFFHNIQRTWEEANTLVVEFVLEQTSLDGSTQEYPVVDIFRFKGDLIADMRIYADVRDIYS